MRDDLRDTVLAMFEVARRGGALGALVFIVAPNGHPEIHDAAPVGPLRDFLQELRGVLREYLREQGFPIETEELEVVPLPPTEDG